jgi:hypothetical protein
VESGFSRILLETSMRVPSVQIVSAAVLALSVAVLSGCAPIEVHSFMDQRTALRRYRTFTWGASEPSTGDPRLDSNRFVEERVRARVEEALTRRGFEKITSDRPDMIVHYHLIVAQQVEGAEPDPGYTTCAPGDCRPSVYDKGTLFVDLVDPVTKVLLWRGWAESPIDGVVENQTWMEERLDTTVARILRRLPNRIS